MKPSPFDGWAEEYDSWYTDHPNLLDMERRALVALGLRGRGLDLGCGTGVMTPAGSVCLEPSMSMIRRARERDLESVVGVAEHLPFRDDTFDFVVMTTALCFFQGPEKAIRESARVLKPDGLLAACIIPRDSMWGKLYEAKKREGHPIFSHANFLTVSEVREMMVKAGIHPDLMVSTLHNDPDVFWKDDFIMEDSGKGGFVCVRGRNLGQTRG